MSNGGRVIDALRLNAPDPGSVGRSLLGALAVTALALYWGPDIAAVWVFGAAAVTGAVALQDSEGGRVPLLALVSLELGAAVLLGALAGAHSALFVAVVAVWCFAAGMTWALGSNAGFVAAAASALLIVAPAQSLPAPSGLLAAGLTVAAGLVQAALVAVWPPQRWRVQREALARAYRSLAADARTVAADRDAQLDVAPLTWLREALVDGPAGTRPAHQAGYRLPERVVATLSELRGHDGDSAVGQTLTNAAAFLDTVADSSRAARRAAQGALGRLDTAVAAVVGPEAAAAQRLSGQLHEVMALCSGQPRRPGDSLASAVDAVRDHLAWTSPVLRHALRLGVAGAVGVAVARFGGVTHGYWIGLTVLMVLRPETAHTYTRCAGRLGAFSAGVVLASLITLVLSMWEPAGFTSAIGAAVFVAVAYVVSGLGYLAVTAAVGAACVFTLDISAAFDGATLENQLFAVVVGGALAVVAHVVLPDHGLIRLRQRAGELLMTEIEYAALVVTAFVHELNRPEEALAAAWQRAFRARAAFEAASGATRIDTGDLRRWLRSYRASLNAVTSACTSLETNLPGTPSPGLSGAFVAAVDDYVDALRGAPPSPAAPWRLDTAELAAANQKVRDVAAALSADDTAARVLVSELATITRSVSGIASALTPVPITRAPTAG